MSSRDLYRERFEELARFGREPDRPDHDGPVVAPRLPNRGSDERLLAVEQARRDVEADG